MNKQKLMASIFALCLYSLGLNAQINPNDFTPGLNFEDEKREYMKLPRIATDFGSKSDDLPFSASLKEICPKPGKQGNIGSCVGWAVGYGAMTMLYADMQEWKGDQVTDEAFSALFIFNQIKTAGCNGGATLAQAGDFLKDYGNCKSKSFDMPAEDCSRDPQGKLKEDAKRYKIKDYYALFSFDEKGSKKSFLTKRSLAANTPVVVGVRMRRNFAAVNKENPFWDPRAGDTTPWGGHAMVVVGYDDKKDAFLLLNSWGSAWGEDGYAWIKYDDYEEFCMFAYQYVLEDKIPTPEEVVEEETTDVKQVELKGKFNFRYPDFAKSTDTEIAFEDAKPTYKSGYYYEMAKKDWEIGDRFQLVVNEMAKGHYIYVFSIDGEGANAHWPRDIDLDGKDVVEDKTETEEKVVVPVVEGEEKMDDKEKENPKDKGKENGKDKGKGKGKGKDNGKWKDNGKDKGKGKPNGKKTRPGKKVKRVLSAGETPLVPFDKVEIIIPGAERALVKRTEGNDHICILYCSEPIAEFEGRVLRVADTKGTFEERFESGFGDLLIDADQVRYKKGKMGFYTNTKTEKTIVPVVLTIEGE